MDPAPADSCAELRLAVQNVTADWRRAGRYVPRSDSWLRSFDPEFSKELAARGLIAMTYPRELGGHARTTPPTCTCSPAPSAPDANTRA